PSAMGALGMGLCIGAANETVTIIYGEWLKNAFLLQAAALGLATSVIGIAELSGEGLVAALVDRIGKRRAVIIGFALNALSYLALPILGHTLIGALIGL